MKTLTCLILIIALVSCKGSLPLHVDQRISLPDKSVEFVESTPDEGATGSGRTGLYLVPKGALPQDDGLVIEGLNTASPDGKSTFGIEWKGSDMIVIHVREGEISRFRNKVWLTIDGKMRTFRIQLDAPYFGPD